jgi:hypothetical protein
MYLHRFYNNARLINLALELELWGGIENPSRRGIQARDVWACKKLLNLYSLYLKGLEKNGLTGLAFNRFCCHLFLNDRFGNSPFIIAGKDNILFGQYNHGIFTPTHAGIGNGKSFTNWLKKPNTKIAFCVLPNMAKMLRRIGYIKIVNTYNCQHDSQKVLLIPAKQVIQIVFSLVKGIIKQKIKE